MVSHEFLEGLLGDEGKLFWAEAPHLGFDQKNFGDLNAL